MDFTLQNLRTGEAHSLSPRGTLIGSADHATIRTDTDSPYLAVLIVRYPGGWAVHGLTANPGVVFNRVPLGVTERVTPRRFDILAVGQDRFRFVPTTGAARGEEPAVEPPPCYVTIRGPDGMEECRAVDHDLLFGRLDVCHVRYRDSRLSRLNALLAADGGVWYVHTLARRPVVRNRGPVQGLEALEDGDELVIGPLTVRVEVRAVGDDAPPPQPAVTPPPWSAEGESSSTDSLSATDETTEPTGTGEGSDLSALREAAVGLDGWLKSRTPTPALPGRGIGAWFGAQKDRLSRFWNDTPEAAAARVLRTGGKFNEAFAVLDRAVRGNPESPGLLRELYRLHEAAGLFDLCYRPLRQIEKLAAARGGSDCWVLEMLARLCEQLGPTRPPMFDRAISYWRKLEAATGVSYARERTAVMATRALRDGGFNSAPAEDD